MLYFLGFLNIFFSIPLIISGLFAYAPLRITSYAKVEPPDIFATITYFLLGAVYLVLPIYIFHLKKKQGWKNWMKFTISMMSVAPILALGGIFVFLLSVIL